MTHEKLNCRLPRRARFIHHATCADHTQRWQGDVLFAQAAWLLRKGDGLFYLRWIDSSGLHQICTRSRKEYERKYRLAPKDQYTSGGKITGFRKNGPPKIWVYAYRCENIWAEIN